MDRWVFDYVNLARPEVSEAAVVGLQSDSWGQKVGAVVVLTEKGKSAGRGGKEWSPLDMRRALRDRLANYKIPQELRLVEVLPRNAMGKSKFLTTFTRSTLSDNFQSTRRCLLRRYLGIPKAQPRFSTLSPPSYNAVNKASNFTPFTSLLHCTSPLSTGLLKSFTHHSHLKVPSIPPDHFKPFSAHTHTPSHTPSQSPAL